MTNIDSQNKIPRAGKNFRSNPNRYFHVMSEGWFLYTREGVHGPFIDRTGAQNFLGNHIEGTKADEDPSAGWRL